MRSDRPAIHVAHLPTVSFGERSMLWWGTIGFMVIEGFTLFLLLATYVYLSRREPDWPPAPHPDPDLLIPTVNTVLLLLLILPMRAADRAAKAFDRAGVGKWLLVTSLLTLPVAVLRWFDLQSLNIAYDSNAYGSAAWAIVVLHGTLVAVDFVETGAMAVLFLIGHAQKKHFSDASDAALYQYFLSLIWIPLYLVVYWGPRVL